MNLAGLGFWLNADVESWLSPYLGQSWQDSEKAEVCRGRMELYIAVWNSWNIRKHVLLLRCCCLRRVCLVSHIHVLSMSHHVPGMSRL